MLMNHAILLYFFSYFQCPCLVVWDQKQRVFEMHLSADFRLLLRHVKQLFYNVDLVHAQ